MISDDEMSCLFPDKQSAQVTVVAKGGTYSERVDFPKGEPENPMTAEEFYNRYEGLMAYGDVPKLVYDSIYEMVNNPNLKVSEIIKEL